MDKITNALKCVNCRSILVSPVFLPCHHSVCKHHALTGSKSPIKCGECGRNHEIPTNGFEDNKPLADIISTQVHSIHLGEAHENAKKDYVSYQSLISRVNDHLADLSLETYEKINEMKNEVLLKREELKQEIDQESEKLIVKLDDYLEIFRNHLNDERVQLLESELEEKIKEATVQLKDFQNRLDLMNADEKSWTATSIEINRRKRILSECLDRLNNSLVVKSDMQELETQMGKGAAKNVPSTTMGDNSLDIEIFALKRPDGLLQLPQVQLPSTSTKSTWSCEYCFAPNEDKLGKCACCNSARTGSNNRASKRIQSPTASSIAASILNFNK